MSIVLNGASKLQSEINVAFWVDKPVSELLIEITATKSSPTKLEGFTLNASRLGEKVTATIGTSEEHAFRYALNALLKWINSGGTTISIDDGPDFQIRGVVEGFYGKAWSHQQRLRGLKFFGDYNMNTYFLAPKDVPWQRFNWRALLGMNFSHLLLS